MRKISLGSIFVIMVSYMLFITAFAGPSDVQRQGESFNNFLIDSNPGFENGLSRWTSSGGSFTKNTTLSNVARGVASGAWDASANGQTLTSRQITIPAGSYGQECVASALVKGGDSTISFKVIDGSLATIGSVAQFPAPYPTFNRVSVQFKCPMSGSVALRFSSTSNAPVVYIDEAFIGQKDTVYVGLGEDWKIADTGTITVNGFTVSAWNFYAYKYVGDELEIQTEFIIATSSGAEFRLGLPNGDVVNDSIFPSSSFSVVGTLSNDSTGSEALITAVGGRSYFNAAFSDGSYTTARTGTDIATTGWTISIKARVPVKNRGANYKLANRSLEEYGSNTSVADSDDSSSFANGSSGSPYPGTLTTSRRKRVHFSSAIQPTDVLVLEFSSDGVAWSPMSSGGESNTISIAAYNSADNVGAAIEQPAVNATDVNVIFLRYASGTQDWSSGAGYWRVRKVAGGALVGYPIGSRNIVQTVPLNGSDGPGQGLVGSSVEATVSSPSNAAASASYKELASILLQPGKYVIFASADLNQNGSTLVATGELAACVGFVSASSSGCVEGISLSRVLIPSAHVSDYHSTLVVNRPPVIITAPTTIYLNTRVDYSSGTPRWTGHIYALAVN